jgi:hypothetical protein
VSMSFGTTKAALTASLHCNRLYFPHITVAACQHYRERRGVASNAHGMDGSCSIDEHEHPEACSKRVQPSLPGTTKSCQTAQC